MKAIAIYKQKVLQILATYILWLVNKGDYRQFHKQGWAKFAALGGFVGGFMAVHAWPTFPGLFIALTFMFLADIGIFAGYYDR